MEKRKLYQSNVNLTEVNGLFQDNSEELFTRKKAVITPTQAKKSLFEI